MGSQFKSTQRVAVAALIVAIVTPVVATYMSSAGLRDAANARAVDTASAMRNELTEAARRLMEADDPRFWTLEWFGMLDRIEPHLTDKGVFGLAYHDKHMDFLKNTLMALQTACSGQPASGASLKTIPSRKPCCRRTASSTKNGAEASLGRESVDAMAAAVRHLVARSLCAALFG